MVIRLRQHGAEIELAARAAHETDDHQPAADREHLEVLREVGGADRVEHDGDSRGRPVASSTAGANLPPSSL